MGRRGVTEPLVAYPESGVEFRHYSPGARAAVLFARTLPDVTIFAALRNDDWAAVEAAMPASGQHMNRNWLIGTLAEIAYQRGLIDAADLDHMTGR